MNARFGVSTMHLVNDLQMPNLHYVPSKDSVRRTNENACKTLHLCCENNLLVLNNLKQKNTLYPGALTFIRGNTWISDLDIYLLIPGVLFHIMQLSFNHNTSLPSNHAPIMLEVNVSQKVDLQSVLEAAESLGDHAVLHSNTQTRTKCKRPNKYHTIQSKVFIANISSIPVPSLDDDIERVADKCVDILYKCSTESAQRRLKTYNAEKK